MKGWNDEKHWKCRTIGTFGNCGIVDAYLVFWLLLRMDSISFPNLFSIPEMGIYCFDVHSWRW